jgi:hypothetical protein
LLQSTHARSLGDQGIIGIQSRPSRLMEGHLDGFAAHLLVRMLDTLSGNG